MKTNRLLASMLLLGALLASASTLAQSPILQGGPTTAGHAPMYSTSGGAGSQAVGVDSGPAGGGQLGLGMSEGLYVARGTGTPPFVGQGTGPFGSNWCDYDAAITNATGYHYLCLSANSSLGGGLIAYGAGGIAAQLPLKMNINGTTYTFPFILSGVIGPNPSIVGDLACWNNITGTLLSDCGAALRGPVSSVNADMACWNGTNALLLSDCGAPLRGPGTTVVNDLPIWNNLTGTLLKDLPFASYIPLISGGGATNFLRADGQFVPIPGQSSVLAYGASGSPSNTTGTISGSSAALTLAAAIDFTNGQGIFLAHAGAAFTASAPSSLTVTPSAAAGTTYAYRISSVDNACGVGAAIAAVTITNGPTALTAAAPVAVTNNLSWSAGAGAWGYAVWRSTSGGAYQLIAVTSATALHDPGLPTAASICVPTTPPASSLADYLVTTIASGGGTTSVALSVAATTAMSAGYVQHSDTASINAAIAALSVLYFPAGTYNIEGGLTISSSVGAMLCDAPSNTFIQSPNVNANGNVIEATTGGAFTLARCNIKSTIPNTVATTRALDVGRSNSTLTSVALTGSTALQIEASATGVQVDNIRVESWYNVGIRTLGTNIVITAPLILSPTAFTGDGSGQAIAIQGGSHVVVSGGSIAGSAQFGVTCTGVNYVVISGMDIFTYHEAIHPQDACNYFTITGNVVNSPYDIAISAADDAGTAAIGPGLINSNTVTQSYAAGIALVATTHNVAEITIDGNAINNPNRNGGGTPGLACGVAVIGQHAVSNTVQNNVVIDDSAFTSWANCEFGSPAPNNNGFGLVTKSIGMLLGTVKTLGAASFYLTRPAIVTGPSSY